MKSRRMSKGLGALLIACAVLICISAVGGTRAALTIFSDEYPMQFEMYHIGITLNENGKALAWRNYQDEAWHVNGDAELFGDIEEFSYGTTYDEALTVTNSGAVDEYVRVTIYTYWEDEDGNKDMTLDPSLIDLHLTEGSGWIKDEAYSEDPERTVLYYSRPLKGSESGENETSAAFADSITISGEVKLHVTQTEEKDAEGYTVVTNTYTYNGKKFCVEVQADGVQIHNAKDAIKSAWGREVEIGRDGSLSIK